jgi:prevent-host-death family protein
MREIGVFEAKTHLSEILDAVEAGESVTITKRGKPIAVLSPASNKIEQRRVAAAELADIKNSIQKMFTTEELIAMRDEGRKH